MTESTKPCGTNTFLLITKLARVLGLTYGVHFCATILRLIYDAVKATVE